MGHRLLTGAAIMASAGILAFLSMGALVAAVGLSPIDGYRSFVNSSFVGGVSIGTTLIASVPYVVCALAFTLAFRCRLFNIGLEGQLLWGALAAAVVGVHVDIPGVAILFALLAAVLAGGVWALLPIALKLWCGASEIVSSLFLNYIAFYMVAWLVGGPLKQPGSPVAVSSRVNSEAELPAIVADTKITIAPLIAAMVAGIVWAILSRSVLGFKIRTIGANARVARHVGIDVRRTMTIAFVASGAIGGLAGGLEVLGNQYSVSPGFSAGWGYTGIAAALLGGATAVGSVTGGFFFGVLDAGGQGLQLDLGVPSALAQVAQAIALIVAVIVASLMVREKGGHHRRRLKDGGAAR